MTTGATENSLRCVYSTCTCIYMYSKSKVLVATVTHAMLYAFASDVAKSCKTTVSCNPYSTYTRFEYCKQEDPASMSEGQQQVAAVVTAPGKITYTVSLICGELCWYRSSKLYALQLCLRKWVSIHPCSEFRCFVHNHKLIG